MLYVNVGLAMTIGLEHMRGRTGSIVHNVAALVIAALTLVAVIAVPDRRPGARISTTRRVGGPFFNLILLGYGLPAVLAIMLALIARTTRPIAYRIAAAITAVTLALFYLTLEVRRLFHGPILAGPTSDAEQYTYSAVWLALRHRAACGRLLAALAAGAAARARRHRADHRQGVHHRHRRASAGIYRALSVIGLGVVLLGIGWLYQRVLYPRPRHRAKLRSAFGRLIVRRTRSRHRMSPIPAPAQRRA